MDNTKLQAFNNRLRELYGLYYDGKPLFRLVWSDSQIEKRWGQFERWSGSVYLGDFTGIAEVPKYPYVQSRWILEKREGHLPSPELPEKICYEPKWVFENKEGPVEPEWWAIELLVHNINNPRRAIDNKDTANDAHDKHLPGSPAHVESERQKVMDVLDDELSDITSALRFGEGVTVPAEIKK